MKRLGRSDGGAVASRPVVRYESGGASSAVDHITVEEPLEIRVAGETLVVTMRTPGNDFDLAAGFVFAEGIAKGAADIGKIVHCGRPGEDDYGNVVEVQPAPGVALDLDRSLSARRGTLATAACGVCGRRTIDDLLERCDVVTDAARFRVGLISEMPLALRRAQAVFAETGGLHAAAVFGTDGRLLLVREDVGRHNAVDKVLGRMLLDHALPGPGCALAVSGRSSFEIVQKAVVARIPLVVSVSAPSTLAIDLAERTKVTLVGFARGAAFNVYTHAERVTA